MNKAKKVAQFNFKYGCKETYIITISIVTFTIISMIINFFLGQSNTENQSIGNLFALINILAPIFIILKYYRKLINIGAKKLDFFKGCILNYIVFAVIVSIINILFYYVIEPLIWGSSFNISFLPAFDWTSSGVFACFIYQTGFYILISVFIHTLVLYQNMWIGWVADVLIITIISVFTPIAPLRQVLITFFRATTLNPSFIMQFIWDILLAGLLYVSTLYNLSKK
ncbi:hypothetical protein SH1V18_00440 [Vallitalea longa]|uniref:Uncharacterized protein n=1 Tax=Vallitalea longa TaxID=2936439 RepID=A0A9W5Y8Z7_9FIRM|nr:hypothetical protein [Vallitalea longa]GKX27564.1 hypothetical protein SH1V18_00440 [Vallitalea longa]